MHTYTHAHTQVHDVDKNKMTKIGSKHIIIMTPLRPPLALNSSKTLLNSEGRFCKFPKYKYIHPPLPALLKCNLRFTHILRMVIP